MSFQEGFEKEASGLSRSLLARAGTAASKKSDAAKSAFDIHRAQGKHFANDFFATGNPVMKKHMLSSGKLQEQSRNLWNKRSRQRAKFFKAQDTAKWD